MVSALARSSVQRVFTPMKSREKCCCSLVGLFDELRKKGRRCFGAVNDFLCGWKLSASPEL